MSRSEYFTQQRLAQLEQSLSERDIQVLASLKRCRYLTTLQIARLHFDASVNSRAAVRASNRHLTRLRELGLIRALSRRIGGVRAGSGSFVWTLTAGGFRLLQPTDQPRKQFREPTLHFLAHTLVISEAYLQLTEICAQHNMTLAGVQFEPGCWRRYTDKGGKPLILKPDLYAVTRGGGYEDHWFIEIDCDTETVARVVDKCERYLQYLHSGAEQAQTGVFPLVVWIVPDEKRKVSVERHIRAQISRGAEIFIVILPDELEALVTGSYIQRVREDSG
ncbi:MAG: replication-relaxation family protein [Oscillospiraceae bacterium]|jgi:hypothetical protein|nr:replication-relaxation family protein [Oscillospiraceae bacterium]